MNRLAPCRVRSVVSPQDMDETGLENGRRIPYRYPDLKPFAVIDADNVYLAIKIGKKQFRVQLTEV